MGRLESLTALALGRGPYEDEVAELADGEVLPDGQQYNGHGHPRNPETKRREREHVRAANEVMQVTGIVEDLVIAKALANDYFLNKSRDTITGLRLMEAGRSVLVAGVWGVLGLRRRILLYQPYARASLPNILRYEKARYGLLHMVGAGLPAVLAYHASDWVQFLFEATVDSYWEELDDDGRLLRSMTPRQERFRFAFQMLLDIGFSYVALHFRMFAILQQLALVPSSRILPTPRSFIPFSASSPLQLQLPLPRPTSLMSWASAIVRSAAPIFMILLHGKVKFFVSRDLYAYIYKLLPRPVGESIFAGLSDLAPTAEYDTPDRHPEEISGHRTEDEPTLRALEGLPALEHTESHSRPNERDSDSSIGGDAEITHATLISFDVEATEAVDTPLGPLGTWSAELRSANEPRQSEEPRYRVTGLTMLPPILATEGLREVAAGLLVMPFEALMVRVIGRAYRASAGIDVEDLHSVTSSVSGLGIVGFGNLASVFALQLGVTGIVWAGFTIGSQWWASRASKNNKPSSVVET